MEISRREFVSLASSAAAVLASPALRAQTVRVRREIRTLSAADVDKLKAGVTAMKALPKDNFRSWMYQAGVHGAPPADSAGVPDAGTYWNQCVHGGLHFLSWHRWELLFIEEILRLMSDHCDFTLPYWDYIANGFLPDPLRLPADATNPLFDASRNAALNGGTGALAGLTTGALAQTAFSSFSSTLYGNPHSSVHGQVSGNMSSVPTAARDPVFWLHHCNIDRYWECWLRSGGGRANPGSPWTEQTFPFRSLTGRRNAIVGDAGRTADLGYTYDNLPCGRFIRPEILEILRNLRLIRVRVRPIPPIPPEPPPPEPEPWPWRPVVELEPIVIDGRPTAVVLPARELARANLAAIAGGRSRIAVTLRDLQLGEGAKAGGFFMEVWLAPSARALRSSGLKGAEVIGSFSTFDVSVSQQHTRHAEGKTMGPAPILLELPEASQQVLAGREDAALVFVRRGLADKEGKPLPFDEKAELFRVGSMRIEVSR